METFKEIGPILACMLYLLQCKTENCCHLVSCLFISVYPHIHLLHPGKAVECLLCLCSYSAMQCAMQQDPALQSPGTISVAITINDVNIYCGFICLIFLCYFLSHVISFSFCPTPCLYSFCFCSHLFLFINISITFFFYCLSKSLLCPTF